MTSRAPTRNPAPSRTASTNLTAPSIPQPSTTPGTISSTSVRRNLFPQAARRQAQHSSNSTSSSTMTAGQHHPGAAQSSGGGGDANSNDIFVRDSVTGVLIIESPQLPAPNEPGLEDEEEEARRRLIESWRKHGGGLVDQHEIKTVLMTSLEAKVQSLDDDGWMFGDEEKDEE